MRQEENSLLIRNTIAIVIQASRLFERGSYYINFLSIDWLNDWLIVYQSSVPPLKGKKVSKLVT